MKFKIEIDEVELISFLEISPKRKLYLLYVYIEVQYIRVVSSHMKFMVYEFK